MSHMISFLLTKTTDLPKQVAIFCKNAAKYTVIVQWQYKDVDYYYEASDLIQMFIALCRSGDVLSKNNKHAYQCYEIIERLIAKLIKGDK